MGEVGAWAKLGAWVRLGHGRGYMVWVNLGAWSGLVGIGEVRGVGGVRGHGRREFRCPILGFVEGGYEEQSILLG